MKLCSHMFDLYVFVMSVDKVRGGRATSRPFASPPVASRQASLVGDVIYRAFYYFTVLIIYI